MKVILTSTGFEDIESLDKIKKIVGTPFQTIKMLVIPLARKYEYRKEKYTSDYIKLGFKEENVYFFDDDNPDLYRNLDIDLIYVCGGNTFLLKDCLEKSNFEPDIIEYVKNRRCYIFRCKCRNTYCNI